MKSKTKKKPAKKAPAPKLIEGKYSHKFLTRLEPDSGKKLEAILPMVGQKTLNGAVRYIVDNYKRVVDLLHDIQQQLAASQVNVRQYRDAIERFRSAFDGLGKVKPVTKVQTSIFDDFEGEEEV